MTGFWRAITCNAVLRLGSIMALSLYRRHNAQCEAKHPKDSHSGELEERSKKWTRCSCPIIAAGSMGKHFKRRKTGRIFWDDAKAVANRWESAGRWPGGPEPPSPPPPTLPAKDRMTVAGAVEAYLAYHRKNSAKNTVLRYQGILKRITDYSAYRGYTLLEQWQPTADVVQCRDMWTCSQRSANSDMCVVRAFFEFSVERGWIAISPALRVKNYRSRDSASTRNEQKLPFTDAELERMYNACDRFVPENPKYAHRSVTGRDLSDFISVSAYTGLRISDASTFHISRMNEDGEIWIRTKKNGARVFTWVPPWLQQIVRRRSLEVGPLIFGEHRTTNRNVIAECWRRSLNRLWKSCGPWEAKPHPHRFRHTFARVLLERPA